MHTPADPYSLLGVPRDADDEAVRRAWREKAKRFHPDVNPSPHAAEAFKRARLAYELLSDARLRAWVDERLRERSRSSASTKPTTHRHQRRVLRIDPGIPRFAYLGLHLTGLCFGLVLVAGTTWQVLMDGWPAAMLFACIPGIAVLPDSMAGLMHPPEKAKAGH
ncbi:MAG: J domain-containing protein [Flavobacteriales bacterium]|nr:J domain-containing protein [Flavobacteriales bacterium]